MGYIAETLAKVYEIFQLELDIFGFSITWWQVFCFEFVVSFIVFLIVRGFFSGS